MPAPAARCAPNAHSLAARCELCGRESERWLLEGWLLEGWLREGWLLEGWLLEGWLLEGRVLEGRVLEGRLLEGRVLERRVLEGRLLERWVLERWVLERWVLERWVLERWLLERWLLEVGPAVVRRRVLAAEPGPLSLSLTRGYWCRLPSYRWGSSRTRGWWLVGWRRWRPCRRRYYGCFVRVALSPALALEWHWPSRRQPALWPGGRECRGHSVAG